MEMLKDSYGRLHLANGDPEGGEGKERNTQRCDEDDGTGRVQGHNGETPGGIEADMLQEPRIHGINPACALYAQ